MILDSHVHCGNSLRFDIIKAEWDEANIRGGVLFSPVEEIYNRYDSQFYDSDFYKSSRDNVHNYLTALIDNNTTFAFYFVWNDFKLPDKNFKGIKWHRHSSEPVYDYGSEKCEAFIEHICNNKLPVIIEEEFLNTIKFIKRINSRTIIIIPHLGFLNGGYERLKAEGIFQEENIWADTALADTWEIEDFADNFGADKLMFGSDFPFGKPLFELQKVMKMFKNKKIFNDITYNNLMRLIGH